MKFNPVILSMVAAFGLAVLGGCASSEKPAAVVSPVAKSPVAAAPAESPTAMASPEKASSGGQVVEVGAYHLELVPEKEGETVHLDLYLQKGDTHEAVPGAKVTAQIQLPDGLQKPVAMEYDAVGKHYTAKLEGAAAGAYQVAVLSDIQGEKVNGRFNFTK